MNFFTFFESVSYASSRDLDLVLRAFGCRCTEIATRSLLRAPARCSPFEFRGAPASPPGNPRACRRRWSSQDPRRAPPRTPPRDFNLKVGDRRARSFLSRPRISRSSSPMASMSRWLSTPTRSVEAKEHPAPAVARQRGLSACATARQSSPHRVPRCPPTSDEHKRAFHSPSAHPPVLSIAADALPRRAAIASMS